MWNRRRRELPAELAVAHAAFSRCAAHVDLAQRAMIRCVPSSPRSTPLPLAVGIQTLQLALADAAVELPGWRRPEVEPWWEACSAAVETTLAGVDRAAAAVVATRELEVALTAVQDLLDPLHAFVDAEQRFQALRRR